MTSLLLPHFLLLTFHVCIAVTGTGKRSKQHKIPNPNFSHKEEFFPIFQPHLVQICLVLLDLHPSVTHSTRQSIFVNALCTTVSLTCAPMRCTLWLWPTWGALQCPWKSHPHPPSITLCSSESHCIKPYKTYIFFFPISVHLEDRMCCLYLVKK